MNLKTKHTDGLEWMLPASPNSDTRANRLEAQTVHNTCDGAVCIDRPRSVAVAQAGATLGKGLASIACANGCAGSGVASSDLPASLEVDGTTTTNGQVSFT